MNVEVEYTTTAECAALQWLSPELTVGKVHPYLFTQCQAIHARSLLPCQDTPFVKATYTASVTAPGTLTALMSALREGAPEAVAAGGRKFLFSQPVPIPSYLIALVVGNLSVVDIGPRTTVFSEPEVLTRAAEEFSETEAFVATAEALVGPYVWGRYDILMLPGSFPYGGRLDQVKLLVCANDAVFCTMEWGLFVIDLPLHPPHHFVCVQVWRIRISYLSHPRFSRETNLSLM